MSQAGKLLRRQDNLSMQGEAMTNPDWEDASGPLERLDDEDMRSLWRVVAVLFAAPLLLVLWHVVARWFG